MFHLLCPCDSSILRCLISCVTILTAECKMVFRGTGESELKFYSKPSSPSRPGVCLGRMATCRLMEDCFVTNFKFQREYSRPGFEPQRYEHMTDDQTIELARPHMSSSYSAHVIRVATLQTCMTIFFCRWLRVADC